MKILALVVLALVPLVTFCDFVPVANYDLEDLLGDWYVNSIYDTLGNNWTFSYCFTFSFVKNENSTVTMTDNFYDGRLPWNQTDIGLLYPDPSNPAILYQENTTQSPFMVLNVSSYPYWVMDTYNATIIGINYTAESQTSKVILFGLSRWYDTNYDIRPFVEANNLTIDSLNHFWFISSACDTHYDWKPLPLFKAVSLEKTWNLIAVYDPAYSGLVPWYTEGGIYDWNQAYCAKMSFEIGEYNTDQVMTLSLKSLYQGGLERSWRIVPLTGQEAVLVGFNINENTLLYVQYADLYGNLILTAGTTTSFFLSTKATILTPIERTIFETALKVVGWKTDDAYIYPIDNSNC